MLLISISSSPLERQTLDVIQTQSIPMNRLLTSLCLTACLYTASTLAILTPNPSHPLLSPLPANAQTPPDLFYTFYGQRIPLSQRPDTIAVAFKPNQPRTRGGLPLHLQLQQDLAEPSAIRTRGSGPNAAANTAPPLQVTVNPLGERYALITLPPGTRSNDPSLSQRLTQQPYVEAALPVLARPDSKDGKSELRNETIVLPNEILISFQTGLANSQIQLLLNRYDLEIIRPLQFTKNRYLVKSRSNSGTAILNIANQLNQVPGIQSATPNFIQALAYNLPQSVNATVANQPLDQLTKLTATLPKISGTPYQTAMLPIAWYLNSTARRGQLPRTDIHATEAWNHSQQGKGSVVAVIDSLIQWDHPDLAANLYTIPDTVNKLPNEQHGWDFANNDPDTRISAAEIATLSPHFQNTFRLSTADLLKQYQRFADRIKGENPKLSNSQIATMIRNYIRSDIAAEFHGTWSAGVVAARPANDTGAIGVAPQAQILPVRVFGLGGEIQTANLVEAIGYAADRKVDVINMSLGGLLPDRELTDRIFEVLDANPKLVIIASAGNENRDGVGFPAAIPGVLSVGATNFTGNRTFYSSFGGRLDLVAPGGETIQASSMGIFTTGGTWVDGFWQGIDKPNYTWGMAADAAGKYVQVQGTSFSAPAVAGVVALMKGEDARRRLDRAQILNILKKTASYSGLSLSPGDVNFYRLNAAVGMGTGISDPVIRLPGLFPQPKPISAEQYFFGSGLVNAEAAVLAVKQR